MPPQVFVLNVGSSSLKFSVYQCTEQLSLEYAGTMAGIGAEVRAEIRRATSAEREVYELGRVDSRAAIEWALAWYDARYGSRAPAVVGHRIVHGGNVFHGPTVLTPSVCATLPELGCWAPLHQPRCLEGVELARQAWPSAMHVASFDTAFHATQPQVARLFALPRYLAEEGIVRYGFHGLSFQSVVRQLRAIAPELSERKWVIAHLGSGASLCAVAHGRSIATTMGLTPLDGVPMASRCGAVDPGVLIYLLKQRAFDVEQLEDALYNRSGLKGLSQLSGDVRLLERSSEPQAHEALEVFVYRVQREVASLAGALQGLDVLVFTGGIGEHSATLRSKICAGLEWLGVKLDAEKNQVTPGKISRSDSDVATWVIASDENGEIAREAYGQMIASSGG